MPHSTVLPLPLSIAAKVAELEQELDELHPGWRERLPFDRLEYNTLARVKWALKRLSLLQHTEGGYPAPRDWEVLIVQDGRNKRKCYAHPVIPAQTSAAPTRNPPSPLATLSTKATP